MNCNCNFNCYTVRTGLLPHNYYKKKCDCYVMELETKTRRKLWGMQNACNNSARELYAHASGRKSNVICLAQTIDDADKLFEYFKIFANVWAYQLSIS